MKKAKKQIKSVKANKKTNANRSRMRFLPALVIAFVATFLWSQPNFTVTTSKNKDDVLGIATNISLNGLLSATNAQRANYEAGNLSLNSKLNSAAQAKANDMVNRNYWSHQTPDGQQPWVFITNTGYQYLSAGENLAFGFNDSSGTIQGWMNSPTHKANLINKIYTEVGFGMANSDNFVNKGPQTVVVAMYANPQAPKPTPQPTPKPQVQSSDIRNNSNENQQPAPEPIPQPVEEPKEDEPKNGEEIVVAYADSEGSQNSTSTKEITRASMLTGKAWSATLVIALVCSSGLLWALHRGYRLSQIIRNGKELIGRNLHIDLLILAIIFLSYILLSTSGYIM